jgi:uncharacterized protein (TIGR03083 family)
MKPVKAIHVVELFPPLSHELLTVLKGLHPADWERVTVCAPWRVRDVAAHLLGGNLGRLWPRDEVSAQPEHPQWNFNQLVNIINADNERWVQAAQRISPEMLIELLEFTDDQLFKHLRRLDPYALAHITVAWASDGLPPNWLDIAREYTEKWLHQQHIREAVNQPLLTGRTWLSPVLDTFMRGLPRTFGNMNTEQGTSIQVHISGEAGGNWCLVRERNTWQLFTGRDPRAICKVQIDQDIAWRLFTKGVTPEGVRQQVAIEGNVPLGEKVLEMVSIMA